MLKPVRQSGLQSLGLDLIYSSHTGTASNAKWLWPLIESKSSHQNLAKNREPRKGIHFLQKAKYVFATSFGER